MAITQFGNMKDYHSNNLTWFKYYSVPSLKNIITFLKNIPEEFNQTKKWLNEIKDENVDTDKYLNSTNHHLLITPFISNYTLPTNILNIIKEIKSIDNLWFESIDTFNYRNINIHNFTNCLGKLLRLRGHKRVPEPPHKTTGVIFMDALLI